MLNASMMPVEALLPIAVTQMPLATAEAVALPLVRYVVAVVVVTVREVDEAFGPKPTVLSTMWEPETETTVPIAPPKPRPLKPRPPVPPP